jgi:hypothetical protein
MDMLKAYTRLKTSSTFKFKVKAKAAVRKFLKFKNGKTMELRSRIFFLIQSQKLKSRAYRKFSTT